MADEPDFILSDGNQTKELSLDGGPSALNIRAVSQENGISISATGKKIGDFSPQASWKGGRGAEYYRDNPEGFFDSKDAWTLNKDLLMNGLMWRFANSIRSSDSELPGTTGVNWQPIYAGAASSNVHRYYSRSFAASASYSADKVYLWIRRVGSPGTLTVEHCADSTGSPGTVNKTVTKTISGVADIVSVFLEFDWTTTQSQTATTTYHIKVYGASTDDDKNHWEIAVNTAGTSSKYSDDNSAWTTAAFSFYFMVTDADVARRLFYFTYREVEYAVSQNYDGSASKLFINGTRGLASSGTTTTLTDSHTKDVAWTTNKWAGAILKIVAGVGIGQVATISSNTTTVLTFTTLGIAPTNTSEYIIYFSDQWQELPTTGLGLVASRPVVFNDIVYFPQGSVNTRKMRFNPGAANPTHEYADDGTNKSYFFETGINASSVPVLFGFASNVASAPAVAWASSLVFANAVTIKKDPDYYFTGMIWHKNALYVFSINGVWAIGMDNKPVEMQWGFKESPSPANGNASASNGDFLYVSWLNDAMRIFGGQTQNIGVSFRGTGLPANRQGRFTSMFFYQQWLFACMSGTNAFNSILVYDGLMWHELMRGEAGQNSAKLIMDCRMQPIELAGFNRMWIDYNGYPVYIDFPSGTNQPLYSTAKYMHEAVIESATLTGTSEQIRGYIKSMTAMTQNLSIGNIQIFLDYQVDDNTHSANWITAPGAFTVSPEDTVEVNASNVFKFTYRLRLQTNDPLTPAIVRNIVANGFERTPFKLAWNVRINIDDADDPTELGNWLIEKAQYPGKVRLTSDSYVLMNGYDVAIGLPTINITAPESANGQWQGNISFTMTQV